MSLHGLECVHKRDSFIHSRSNHHPPKGVYANGDGDKGIAGKFSVLSIYDDENISWHCRLTMIPLYPAKPPQSALSTGENNRFAFLVVINTFQVGVNNATPSSRFPNGSPLDRYKTWVTNPQLAQEMAEKVTRRTIGVACCPVAGIPPPNKEEEEELLELTNELNLT